MDWSIMYQFSFKLSIAVVNEKAACGLAVRIAKPQAALSLTPSLLALFSFWVKRCGETGPLFPFSWAVSFALFLAMTLLLLPQLRRGPSASWSSPRSVEGGPPTSSGEGPSARFAMA